ncbi:MAG: hypothetical protein ACI92I_000340 [Acidimicrobiales bacterium]|jgi:hypothetical protein
MAEKAVPKKAIKKTTRKVATRKAASKTAPRKTSSKTSSKTVTKSAVRKAPTSVPETQKGKINVVVITGVVAFIFFVGVSVFVGVSGEGQISIKETIESQKEGASQEERDLIDTIPVQQTRTAVPDGGLVPSGVPVAEPEPVVVVDDTVASSTDAVASSTDEVLQEEQEVASEEVDGGVVEEEVPEKIPTDTVEGI